MLLPPAELQRHQQRLTPRPGTEVGTHHVLHQMRERLVLAVHPRGKGGSFAEMETEVVDVVEDALTSVQGVKEITSTSRRGMATVSADGSQMQIIVYNYYATIAQTGSDNVTVTVNQVKDLGPGAHHGTLSGGARLMASTRPGDAAVPASDKMLQLDGNGSYVELPPHIFDGLTEATVEVWVKWMDLHHWMDVFDFGRDGREFLVVTRAYGHLEFRFNWGEGEQSSVAVGNILRTNEWCHLAAVSGRGGMKFYFNGLLVGTNAYRGSFAALQSGEEDLRAALRSKV